jgi:hypothetical protein
VVVLLQKQMFHRHESSHFGSLKPLHKTFWHVKTKDVDQVSPLFICDPIKGTMKINSICATNKNNLHQLLVKNLACFCEFCWDSCWTDYQNIQWIGPWVPRQVQPHDIRYVWETMYESWDRDY